MEKDFGLRIILGLATDDSQLWIYLHLDAAHDKQNNRYILSYNGEIYNYRELRAELEAKRFWFRSQTDSEVVLNALIQWGTMPY